MVFALGGDATASGGHARWLRRRDAAYLPPEGDECGIAVGADGYAEGWQGECQRMLSSMTFDAEGFAVDATSQVRLEGDALAGLAPALQMQARARVALGEICDELPIEDCAPYKGKTTRVNLRAQRANHEESVAWAARTRATAVYAGDGTRSMIK